ncbi:MAG: hypothetical protein J6V01_05350, partial [Clostridia bacterium]|nr:hypothetical protein [Clostridia bacterium]
AVQKLAAAGGNGQIVEGKSAQHGGLLFPGTAVRRISPSLNNMHGGLSRALRRMDTRDVGILYLSALTVFILSALHCSHISAASRTAVMIDGGLAEHND